MEIPPVWTCQSNTMRAVGTRMGSWIGLIWQLWITKPGAQIQLYWTAGQSFGAFITQEWKWSWRVKPMTMSAKALGWKIDCFRTDASPWHLRPIPNYWKCGCFGATGSESYQWCAGERFCVELGYQRRCWSKQWREYMTGGVTVIREEP